MIRPTPVHRPVWEPVYRDVQGPVWRNGAGGSGIAYPRAIFHRAYAYTATPWTASDSQYCTLLFGVSLPLYPTVSAGWSLVTVGRQHASGTTPRVTCRVGLLGKLSVTVRSLNGGSVGIQYEIQNAGDYLLLDTYTRLQLTVDSFGASGEKVRLWRDGTEIPMLATADGSAAAIQWSATGDGNAARSACVGSAISDWSTFAVDAPKTLGYIDGGAGDVPVTVGLCGFTAGEAITTPFSATHDMAAEASRFNVLMGQSASYDAADWAAGTNMGTKGTPPATLTVAELP